MPGEHYSPRCTGPRHRLHKLHKHAGEEMNTHAHRGENRHTRMHRYPQCGIPTHTQTTHTHTHTHTHTVIESEREGRREMIQEISKPSFAITSLLIHSLPPSHTPSLTSSLPPSLPHSLTHSLTPYLPPSSPPSPFPSSLPHSALYPLSPVHATPLRNELRER